MNAGFARSRWRRVAGAGAAITAAAVWAFRPVPVTEFARELGSEPVTALRPTLAMDLAGFRAPIWVTPPATPIAATPPAPAPPPAPLRLQLLSIAREDDGQGNSVYRALLYDPDTDSLVSVREREAIGPHTVQRVTALDVALKEGEVVRTLALVRDGIPVEVAAP